jgi:hypothetical protein
MKMKLGNLSVRKTAVLSAVAALSLAIAPLAISQTTSVVATASVVSACGKLFDVDSNAAGLTAQERAAIIQKNLDNAIINAKNRTPDAVRVMVVNRNPIVALDGYHIATADGNSAARNRMTQMQLAQKWADSIKFCLADAAAMDKYLSMLTGKYPQQAAAPRRDEIAYMPAGAFLPVKMVTPISSETSMVGDRIEAVLSTDVPLRTDYHGSEYSAYLPAGSVAVGELVDATNSFLGKNALGVRFNEIRTPDGEVIPVNAHVFGGIGTWVHNTTDPQVAECGGTASILKDELGGSGLRERTLARVIPSKGQICGGWRGRPIGAGLDIPYMKLTFARRTNIQVPSGEPMLMQLAAPSTIAVCTNCGSGPAM